MVWYRGAKLNIHFSCETEDGRIVFTEEGRMVAIAPYDFIYKKFSSKEEADALGTLETWAQEVGNRQAEKAATDYCGEGSITVGDFGSAIIETDENSDLNKLFKPKIPIIIPADIRANIVIMLERIKNNLDDTDYIMFDLIPQLDKYLSSQGLTRNDIRDIILEVGLENVIK